MAQYDDLDLTESKKKAIEELKKRMAKDMKKEMLEDTFMFYRFLKVQDFDVNQAEKILRETLEWRRLKKIDTILEDYEPPEVLHNYVRKSRFAIDKYGRTVHYSPVGKMDPKGMLMSVKPIDMEKTFAQNLERDEKDLLKKRKKPGGPYPGYVYIYDMAGLSFAAACDKKGIENYIKLANICDKYYPERVEVIYIINVSPYFGIVFNLVKNFVSTSFIEKGIFLSDKEYKEELSKIVDADDLPAFLGGKRTDPDGDPQCKTIIDIGGKIDESRYINKSKRSLQNEPDRKKLVLSRAAFSEIELEIKEAGSVIEWEFETKARDIGFGLFFKEMVDEEEKVAEIVPLMRLDTEQFTETGVYTCENVGTYVMLFDNSYSWMRSKEIYYRTSIMSPDDVKTKIKH